MRSETSSSLGGASTPHFAAPGVEHEEVLRCARAGPARAGNAGFAGGASLTVWIDDFGRGMLPRHDSPGLGLGLALMTRLSDDLQFSSHGNAAGTCVTATFRRITRAVANRTDRHHTPTPGSGRREILLDDLQALGAAQTALRHDTDAVLAQAELAVARARRQRHQRMQHR